MPTIHREHGLRFAIYVDDHPPPHLHVLGDGELKVIIRGKDGFPLLVYAAGMKARLRRCAMDVVLERQAEFLGRWLEIHGDKE
ncbi:MAG: hypothetical protein QOG13_927 [Sphingomonadales bacterium]|jgi:hypothetical protein|nr:hypothetical protein [Sphingomonadales bacterium]